MNRINYSEIENLKNLYLEDSYVLAVAISDSIRLDLDAVLIDQNPYYSSPKSTEQYCYRKLSIEFPRVRSFEWHSGKITPSHDSNHEVDYGNIDKFYKENDSYFIEGDFGKLVINSEQPNVIYI